MSNPMSNLMLCAFLQRAMDVVSDAFNDTASKLKWFNGISIEANNDLRSCVHTEKTSAMFPFPLESIHDNVANSQQNSYKISTNYSGER